jgi:hypothetical protein
MPMVMAMVAAVVTVLVAAVTVLVAVVVVWGIQRGRRQPQTACPAGGPPLQVGHPRNGCSRGGLPVGRRKVGHGRP